MPRPDVTESEVSSGRAGIRAPDLVGRERELTALVAAVGGGPSVVLIEGEAGIGKTRLVREFLSSPAGRRAAPLVACCPPFRQPHTLGPVVDAIRQTARDVAALRLSELAGALRPLFPEWATALPPAPGPLEDATAARHRVFRALAELLAGLGTRLLVVEDAHWADEATLEFLLFLASGPAPQLTLVLTSRPEDVPDGSLLRRLSRLAAGSTGVRLALDSLDVAQTGRLISSMLAGEHVSEQFAAFLHERTEGLPLAVEESIRLMGDRSDLAFRHGAWARRHLDSIEVPPTVRDAVLERTDRLGPAALAVLRAAAVLGEPAPESVLLPVAGLAGEEGRAGLYEALGCGLLTDNFFPYGQTLTFRHMLAARAVYEAIPAPLRRELHLRAGCALEDLPALPPARLARHFREAGDSGAWCRYGEQAADLALAAGDHNAAAALLHDLVANAGLPAGAIARLASKVPIMAFTGYAPVEDLIRSLRSILASDALTPAQRGEARWQLGRILFDAGEYESAATELAEAIGGLTHRPLESALAMIWLGWPCLALWPAAEHRRWLDRAAGPMADRSISPSDQLRLISTRATALLMLGEDAGWDELARLPRELASSPDALIMAVNGLNNGEVAISWGRYAQAHDLLTGSLRLGDEYAYPRVRDCVLVALAHLDWFTGSWDGLAARAEALAGLEDVEPLVPVSAMLVSGLLDQAAGATEAAEKKLRLVLDEVRRRGMADLPLEPAAALARLRLAEGATAEALGLTDEPIEVIAAKGIWIWATEVAPVRVRALLAACRTGEAADLVAAFACGLAGRSENEPAPAPSAGAAPAAGAALLLCQALLAEAAGPDPAAAAEAFGQAADAWQVLPRPYDALLAQERQARCLLVAGVSGEALDLLSTVQRELATLGARADAERIAALLREQGVPVRHGWRGGRRGYGDELSPRELEVVRLMVAGHTSREIGQSLCRSPKTVDTQLKSAMRKLGAASRTALAVRAAELGIAPTVDL
ncbi:MAG TPA: AAA family ATPase [Streptosporangiaceae bacterium]|jgi:DNA-binding CsgD family transcriptional regulator